MRSSVSMKKEESKCSLARSGHVSRSERLLTESLSSDEGPETERLLGSQLPAAVVAAASGRRQSLTAPPSPTDSRKHHHHRHHNYMNHWHHFIHWKDIWHGEPHKGHESLHRSESMVSLACFKTLSQLANSENTVELQQYLATNKSLNVDDKDENGTTALMCACESGRVGAARLLLAVGADANAADDDGWTPLAFAARGGHLATVKELLDAGAKVDPRDCGGWTPLMWASYKGHDDVVGLLLEKGADVHAHGNYNITSLLWAAGRKHSGVVQKLLAAGARPNSCDKYGTSALTWAARAGDVTSCAALLRAGADPNTAGMYCWTPLLQATQGNHFEIVQMLLENKPNVNALDKDGYTALAIACKEGYYDIALALINSGAYINVQDHSKDTPLIHAVKGGHKNIVEALLKKHVDVDLPGKDKKTPVYTAVEKGHVAILKLLLASNPDLEHCTVTGDTPLLRAVRSRNAEMVQLLLERKARVNVADNRGDTALHVAMRARSKQIVEILLRNPKNSQLLYKPNKQNETPYNIDMSYNKTILGQIFGARKLNTNEDTENMLGYELYSAALADMLSEPSLSVPITVGLFARWGSGKSFLLNKLKEEMKNFARQWSETGWAWSWAVSWSAWHAALSIAALVAIAGAPPYVAVIVCFALFAVIYLALYILWYLGNRYEWWWAGGLITAMGHKFGSLLLVLQVVFCHPPGPNDPRALPATPIRFHFTEGLKSGGGQEGSAMVVQMIASLAEALESQYGRVCTRLARAFRPQPASSTAGWRWRRVCCVPHIVTFELCFTCLLVGVCGLILYFTEPDDQSHQKTFIFVTFRLVDTNDLTFLNRNVVRIFGADDDQTTTNHGSSFRRRKIHQGLMIGACALAGAVMLANLYTWGRVLAALVLPPRTRLARALKRDAPTLALRPEVQILTHIVSCLDAFTGQQTRLVVVVDALDSCEQEKVLALLNAVHALCSDPKSPFILLLAIDPHIISKAVEVNSRRAFSESNIGGWDYLRNMVQLPFYLQNSALRRVKTAQQTAAKRMQTIASEDFSTSLQRSVSARRLSSTSELMSSQERIKNQPKELNSTAAARMKRLRPSESVASSVASGLHRAAIPSSGAADLGRVLLTDDYFSDVNPRSMRRLMNVLYITGRLLKAFQIEFNWYQLASWVNLTEQWPFRTSWIIYHHETYEEHIDDSTSLKHIYEKVKPLMSGLREASTLMELDRDERKLDVFLSFHRSTLTAADMKVFLPFTINLDPYIKKVIKEEQAQGGVGDEELGGGAAWAPPPRPPHAKLYPRKHRTSPPSQPAPPGSVEAPAPVWVGWSPAPGYMPPAHPSYMPPVQPMQPMPPTSHMHPMPQMTEQMLQAMTPFANNPYLVLKTAFPGLGDVSSIRLSTLSVESVCGLVRAALGEGASEACAALRQQRVSGLALAVCDLASLRPILNLPFGDWELFQLLVNSLRDLEMNMPLNAPAVNVIPEKCADTEPDSAKHMAAARPALEHQRSRPSNVEKQVTLEEQMICGALQTLNEEAMEDVMQSDPAEPDEESELRLPSASRCSSAVESPPRARRRDAPNVTFNVENEEDSDDGHITFSARAAGSRQAPRSRPASLLVEEASAGAVAPPARSLSVDDTTGPVDLKLRTLRRTADTLRKVGSAERLSRLKDKIIRGGGGGSRERSPARRECSDDEALPLVAPAPAASPPPPPPLALDCGDRSLPDVSVASDLSPRSDLTELESPRGADFDMLPERKSDEERGGAAGGGGGGGALPRADSGASVSNMVEPYNMRLLARGGSDARALWRQDALDTAPPWPWDEPDSAV